MTLTIDEPAQRAGVVVRSNTVTIPRGVQVAAPIRITRRADAASALQTTIVAEPESDATVIEELLGDAGAAGPSRQISSTVEITVQAAARLRYYHLQNWSRATDHTYTQQATVERGGQFLSLLAAIGGRVTKASVETRLVGPGARGDLYGVAFGDEQQQFEFQTLQDHVVAHTSSDLLYKTALRDHAVSRYHGLIRIAKDAQKSDAYQANRNLLLSEHAKADSIPMLEILADDVRCTHGATVGPVDAEQAFYLMSRGIPFPTAEQMIVEGFFDQVYAKLPAGGIREQLHEHIERKLGRR